jgi:DNA polymerase-3 subunit delta
VPQPFPLGCPDGRALRGARAVWLRNLNFLAATVVGRSESVTTTLEDLKPLLEAANPDELRLLISAEGVDKR